MGNIGIFDSGLGGLTVVKEIIKLLPKENIIYFGDTGRIPYGTRSKETIIRYVKQDIKFLLDFDIKLIIAACGTASAIALDFVREEYNIPIIGVVEPAVLAAAKVTKTGKIGILGTQATISSGAYEKKLKEINKDISITLKACPMLVPLVENGYINHRATDIILKEYLEPMKEVDTLILGCTHYPMLERTISKIMNVNLINPGKEAAKHVFSLLKQKNMAAPLGNQRYFVSDTVDYFKTLASMFLEQEIEIEKIDIEKY